MTYITAGAECCFLATHKKFVALNELQVIEPTRLGSWTVFLLKYSRKIPDADKIGEHASTTAAATRVNYDLKNISQRT